MCYFRQHGRKGLSPKVLFGQRQEGREEMSHVDIWRKNILTEGNGGGKALRRSVHSIFQETAGKLGGQGKEGGHDPNEVLKVRVQQSEKNRGQNPTGGHHFSCSKNVWTHS